MILNAGPVSLSEGESQKYLQNMMTAGLAGDTLTRWWFEIFFIVTPILGEMIQFDQYVSNGLVQPPTRIDLSSGLSKPCFTVGM